MYAHQSDVATVLRRFLLCAIVLHCIAADASDRVRVEAPVVPLRTEQDRARWCGRQQRIDACTRIVGAQLTGEIIERDGRCRIAAAARFIAFIGLKDTSRYGHEMIHVRDIESSIESYIADLERVSFATREACERAHLEATNQFVSRVRAFAEASNLLRDGDPHPER